MVRKITIFFIGILLSLSLSLSLAELLILNRQYISGNIKILSLSQRRVMTVFA